MQRYYVVRIVAFNRPLWRYLMIRIGRSVSGDSQHAELSHFGQRDSRAVSAGRHPAALHFYFAKCAAEDCRIEKLEHQGGKHGELQLSAEGLFFCLSNEWLFGYFPFI